MKIDRSQVELVLADATADPVSRWHVNDTFNRELVAELARAWLALEAAPVGTLRDSIDFDGDTGMDESEARALIGQRVRLVATSGGE